MPFSGRSGFLQWRYGKSGDLEDEPSDVGQITQIERHMLLCLKYGAGAGLLGTYDADFEVTIGSGLSVVVAPGTGLIAGLVIYKATSTTKSGLTPNSTLYIYLKKTATTPDDATFTVEQSLSGAGMTDAILIASCVTGASTVTSVENDPAGRTPHIPFVASGLPGLKTVGASGCDYTNPRTAIQAATAGDTILITPGAYTVTASITVPAHNISIIGMSRDACIINFTAATSANCLVITNRDGIRIAHLTIALASGNTGAGIYGTTVSDALIEDVTITSVTSLRAVYLTAGSRNRILRCHFNGAFAEAVVFLTGCLDGFITETRIANSTTGAVYGLILHTSSRTRAVNNTILMSGAAPTRALFINASDGALVMGNRIELTTPGADAYGIFMKAGAANSARIRLLANKIIGADVGEGIRISYDASYTLTACQVNDNLISDWATAINITGANVVDTRVHDNFFYSCAAGLADSGTSTNAADNT